MINLFKNMMLFSTLVLFSIYGQQALSKSAIPDDQCAIITGATKDFDVAFDAIRKFKGYSPVIVQTNTGYLAPSIGIYYRDGAEELVEDFKRNGIIPADSYCGNADRFINVYYPNENFTELTTIPYSPMRSYVGEWQTDPSACGVKDRPTNGIYIDNESITFHMIKRCEFTSFETSPVNPLYMMIGLKCFEEGDEYESSINLGLSGYSILNLDTGIEYAKCP